MTVASRYVVGTRHTTNKCGVCEVIEQLGGSPNRVRVRFQTTGHESEVFATALYSGTVKDSSLPPNPRSTKRLVEAKRTKRDIERSKQLKNAARMLYDCRYGFVEGSQVG
jgi:hypothetical protein